MTQAQHQNSSTAMLTTRSILNHKGSKGFMHSVYTIQRRLSRTAQRGLLGTLPNAEQYACARSNTQIAAAGPSVYSVLY